MRRSCSRWRAKGELTNLVFTTRLGSTCTRYIVEKEVKKVLKLTVLRLIFTPMCSRAGLWKKRRNSAEPIRAAELQTKLMLLSLHAFHSLTDIKEFFGVQRGQASRILNQWYFMLDDGCLPGEIVLSLALDEIYEILPILQKQMEEEQRTIDQGNLRARIDAEFDLAVMKTIEEKIQLRLGGVFVNKPSVEESDELPDLLLENAVGKSIVIG